MLVVLIVSILVVYLSMRRIASQPYRSLDKGVRTIEGALWEARFMAVKDNRPYMVILQDGQEWTGPPIRYAIRLDNGNGAYNGDAIDLPPDPAKHPGWEEWQELDRGVFFDTSVPYAPIIYNGQGAAQVQLGQSEIELVVVTDDDDPSNPEVVSRCIGVYGRYVMSDEMPHPKGECDSLGRMRVGPQQ
jgi:hypothetical protein